MEVVVLLGNRVGRELPSPLSPWATEPKTSRNVNCMETINLTDGFDKERIVQICVNLSAGHSIARRTDCISLFLAPTRGSSQDQTDY